MKAIEISTPGGPDVLRLVNRPEPAAGAGEVMIEVVAAGVNRPDLMQREGKYPPPKGTTDIPGLEVSGRIVALGPADETGAPSSASGRRWQIGDEVCALVAGGGYAERCVAPGVQCLPIPAGVALADAAAMPETFFTVWTNLFERGRLAAGEWVLVHGGGSGIGTTAVQMAAARGARVMATAGSDDRCRAIAALGATRPINYRTDDFVISVAEITGGHGADVILDIVGGTYFPRNLECLAKDGRLVQVGLIQGATSEIALRQILLEAPDDHRINAADPIAERKGAIAAALEREIWPLIAAGKIGPIVSARVPLANAADAHRRLEGGTVIGKVLLEV